MTFLTTNKNVTMSDFDTMIRTYLAGEMPEQQRMDFERSLKTDSLLQKEYVKYVFGAHKATGNAYLSNIRSIADRVRDQAAPLPEPSISWLDRLKYGLYPPFGVLLLLVGALAIMALAYANFGLKGVGALANESFQKPDRAGVAGGHHENSQSLFEKSSNFYWSSSSAKQDSLAIIARNCQVFCAAHYFLAHQYLKRQDFDAAIKGFQDCIAHREMLESLQIRNMGKLKFNLVLSEFGKDKGIELLESRLAQLLDDPDCQGDIRVKAGQLLEELRSPWRKLDVVPK